MIVVECYTDISDLDAFIDTISTIRSEHDCLLQVVDARYIAGEIHIQTAIDHTLRAVQQDDMIARDPNVELMLYLAASRQINNAFDIGIGSGRTPALVIIHGGDEDKARNEVFNLDGVTVSNLNSGTEYGSQQHLQKWFDITDQELATDIPIEFLVSERVALLTVEK